MDDRPAYFADALGGAMRISRIAAALVAALVSLVPALLAPTAATAATYEVLYRFTGGAGGAGPTSGLVTGPGGALYGVTMLGGVGDCGTIYRLAPSGAGWRQTVLRRFGGSDGCKPFGELAVDADGALYGTTTEGGTGDGGVAFRLAPPAAGGGAWTYRVIHAFRQNDGGCIPVNGVVLGPDGALYGSALQCGRSGLGTIYRLTPPAPGNTRWGFTVLRSLGINPLDSFLPYAKPTLTADGAVFASGIYGGACGCGNVFRLTPPPGGGLWGMKRIYAFRGGMLDAAAPNSALTIDGDGVMFGTSVEGGFDTGAVYAITPNAGGTAWTEKMIFRFSRADYPPSGGTLILDGAGGILGTTGNTFYRLTPPPAGGRFWQRETLHSWTPGPDGFGLVGDLLPDGDGGFYGTTAIGGVYTAEDACADGCGVVYRVTPAPLP